MTNLASVYESHGQHKVAEKLHVQALAIQLTLPVYTDTKYTGKQQLSFKVTLNTAGRGLEPIKRVALVECCDGVEEKEKAEEEAEEATEKPDAVEKDATTIGRTAAPERKDFKERNERAKDIEKITAKGGAGRRHTLINAGNGKDIFKLLGSSSCNCYNMIRIMGYTGHW